MPRPNVRSPRYAQLAYQQQKNRAKHRGIGFELTFEEWMKIWNDSGKFHLRGVGTGYVMCRKGDVGPYAVGNVYIETGIHNSSTRGGTSTIGIGVQKRGKRFRAARVIDGKMTYLGLYDTIEEAEDAYRRAWKGPKIKVWRER